LTDTFVIAAATLSNLSEPSKLRPWLFALARNECRRRIRPASAVRDGEADAVGEPDDATDELADAGDDVSDATVQFRAVGRAPAAGDDVSDATVQFRAVGRAPAAGDDLSDATLQFQMISPLADLMMPIRVISQPAYDTGHIRGDQGQAELRSMIHSVLAGLKPREREVIELSFRHDLDDDDLAIVLGMPQSRAHELASRARGRLEEVLGALHIALTGREACPVLGELLADWDGQLTEQTRDLVVWHIGECQTCARHGWGAMRPAAFSRLLPLTPLPQELRKQVLNLCTSTAEDAVTYRRQVVRRAKRIWFGRISRAARHASWSSIRANPGVTVAVVAVAMWVVAAVSVTMITVVGSRAADAQTTTGSRAVHAQASVATFSRSPAAATATAPTSAARPSPTVTQPSASGAVPVQTMPSRVPATSLASSRSTSSSPQPSKSPKPSRSGSPSPSPSRTSSPSPSSSTSPPAN
jgi:RNA polymerase sigma factor (sigma-70 family)